MKRPDVPVVGLLEFKRGTPLARSPHARDSSGTKHWPLFRAQRTACRRATQCHNSEENSSLAARQLMVLVNGCNLLLGTVDLLPMLDGALGQLLTSVLKEGIAFVSSLEPDPCAEMGDRVVGETKPGVILLRVDDIPNLLGMLLISHQQQRHGRVGSNVSVLVLEMTGNLCSVILCIQNPESNERV